jgi:hypothetical protein
MPPCNVDGCTRPHRARGMCATHYVAWRARNQDEIDRRKATTVEDRFWKYVKKGTKTECWPWTGNRIPPWGYGQLEIRGLGRSGRKAMRAHRLSYELHYGPIPADLFVLHACDNPPCVNPHHLFLGNAKRNAHDMMMKGRHTTAGAKGTAHGLAKLDDEKVRLIRSSPLGCLNMARQLGVSKKTVLDVRAGRTWSHVT